MKVKRIEGGAKGWPRSDGWIKPRRNDVYECVTLWPSMLRIGDYAQLRVWEAGCLIPRIVDCVVLKAEDGSMWFVDRKMP